MGTYGAGLRPEIKMADNKTRIEWWQEARFGMFIHWGLYTIDGLDCWKMHNMGIPTEEYIRTYEHRFNPDKFDAEALADLAVRAGCKYVVMGSRHHEGYCLWNTKTTKFSSVAMTPKRDFIGEYVDAVRAARIGVGFYYSFLDWRFQAYWDGPRKNPTGFAKLVDYTHAQVEELMTLYGKIDILWYDGAWRNYSLPGWGFIPTDSELVEAWRSKELNAMVREINPDIVINDRSYLPEDYGTPEQTITPQDRTWELCDTMGDFWGAAPQDLNRKTAREIITRLITCVSQGGNMLLNIGPNADGSIQDWQRENMERIGDWMDKHNEAIYGCGGEWAYPFNHGLAPWKTTRKGKALYIHLLRYPGSTMGIGNLHDYWLDSAHVLGTNQALEITHEPTRDIITGLPNDAPDDIATVIKVSIREKTEAEKSERATIALEDPDSILDR